MSPLVMLVGPALDEDDVQAVSRTESRSDSSKPRIIAVIPTIDVIPMTTQHRERGAQLVAAHGVERHHDDFTGRLGAFTLS